MAETRPNGGASDSTNNYARSLSILYMTAASALHFAGYEASRSGTLALLTSPTVGFRSSSAISLAVGCVSPVSIGLLWLYTRLLDRQGPRRTLFYTSLFFTILLICSASILLGYIEQQAAAPTRLSRSLLFGLFVLQNSLVQLLYSQHWSFLSSVVQETWLLAPIAGVGSVTSTLAGLAVSPMVDWFDKLSPLLLVGGVLMLLATACGDLAYQYATRAGVILRDHSTLKPSSTMSLRHRATVLFRRVPILGLLCLETVANQFQSSILNFLYVVAVKETITIDAARARYTARSYTWINFASGVLQFGLLPLLSRLKVDMTGGWLVLPTVMLVAAVYMMATGQWTLWLLTQSFVVMKTLEYSLRSVLSELVYVTLDHESRFVGKQIVALFANRLGKSAVAVALTMLSMFLPESWSTWIIRRCWILLCALWVVASYRLSTSKASAEKVD